MQSWLNFAGSWLSRKDVALSKLDGLSLRWQIIIFLLVLTALVSRRPNLFTHAQFYAEDGMVFFAQAYNEGWLHGLLLPQAGYLQTMPRLGAGLALLVPLLWAPLVMALAGMLVQAVPVTILLSRRCCNWASLPTRIALAATYLALPNQEIHVVVTNSQWHLAVAAALIVLATSPRTWLGRWFDAALLLLTAVTGPFGIVLAPIALVFWWLRRQPWSLALFTLTSIGSAVQIAFLLHGGPRVQVPLGATVQTFLRLFGGDVVADSILGMSSFAWRAPMALIAAVALVGLTVCLYCLCWAAVEWKLFLLYCAALLAAALRSPLTAGTKPAWDSLMFAVSARYWFLPMLAFAWSAVWCARYGRDRLFRILGTGILLSMSLGVVRDWHYQAFADTHFAAAVQRMHDAAPGDHILVPITPEGWSMELVKRPNISSAQ